MGFIISFDFKVLKTSKLLRLHIKNAISKFNLNILFKLLCTLIIELSIFPKDFRFALVTLLFAYVYFWSCAILIYLLNVIILSKHKSKKYLYAIITLCVGYIIIIFIWRTLNANKIYVIYTLILLYVWHGVRLFKYIKNSVETKEVSKYVLPEKMIVFLIIALLIYQGIYKIPKGLTQSYTNVEAIYVIRPLDPFEGFDSIFEDSNYEGRVFEIEDTKRLYDIIESSRKNWVEGGDGMNNSPAYKIVIVYVDGNIDYLGSSGENFYRTYYSDNYVSFSNPKIWKQLEREGVYMNFEPK